MFGSASMGALRAAELHSFGMRGVGRIFEAFVDGALEDDDEVAVVHGPEEIGYLSLSEPMVNIRATLAAAEAQGVLNAAASGALTQYAKSLFFPERNWTALLAQAISLGVSEAEAASLRDWLPNGALDQKRLDALEMLSAMREILASGQAFRPNFHFEWTHLWDEFVFNFSGQGPGPSAPSQAILDELRIQGPEAYAPVETRACCDPRRRRRRARPKGLTRRFANGAPCPAGQTRPLRSRRSRPLAVAERPRRDFPRKIAAGRGLPNGDCGNGSGRSLEPYLLDELRLSGDYPRLVERARVKQARLGETRA